MTHSGHERPAFAAMHGPDLLYLARDLWPWGMPHEAARVHHVARRRGGCGNAAAWGSGAGLSQSGHHARRQFSARRLDRCNGSHPARAAEPVARAEYHHRQSRRCWWYDGGRGSAGIGSSHHICGELIKQKAGIDMVHVPYRGGAPLMQDLLAGNVKVAFNTLPTALPQAQVGAIRVIAVAEKTRLPEFPDTPTIDETIPGVINVGWNGLLAPAGTPAP